MCNEPVSSEPLQLVWVFRYLAGGKRDTNDPSTHKWMMYVRGPKDEPQIDHFVDKVIFLLHDTYKPNNIVTVKYVHSTVVIVDVDCCCCMCCSCSLFEDDW